MRPQSAIFVDAGYLMAAAATRLTGSSLRRGISVDYEALVVALVDFVEERSALPLLRVYWYDASRNAVADLDQERLASLAKVKLRLGRIGVEGEQKGVDLRIGLDMVSHSRNGAVDTIYLLSGDDDLTEAVEEAQAQGVKVFVLAVPRASGSAHGVSRHLAAAADGVEMLTDTILDDTVRAATTPPPITIPRVTIPAPTALAPTAPAASGNAQPSPIGVPGQAPRTPEPAGAAPRVAPARPAPPTTVYSGSTDSQSYVAPQFQREPEELTRAIDEVVKKTFDAWSAMATQSQQDVLREARPIIPRDLDRALLLDLSNVLNEYDLSDSVRFQLRDRFWAAVDE